jgi:hypothetical protein
MNSYFPAEIPPVFSHSLRYEIQNTINNIIMGIQFRHLSAQDTMLTFWNMKIKWPVAGIKLAVLLV